MTTEWDIIKPEEESVEPIQKGLSSLAKTNEQEIEALIQECLTETAIAHTEKYEIDKASKTAAKFLFTRMKLAEFIGDIELRAKQSKSEIDRVKAEKWFELKDSSANGKKITDALMEALVAKDKDVILAKREFAEAESQLKKFSFLIDTLKDGHYFFKGLAKQTDLFSN